MLVQKLLVGVTLGYSFLNPGRMPLLQEQFWNLATGKSAPGPPIAPMDKISRKGKPIRLARLICNILDPSLKACKNNGCQLAGKRSLGWECT